MIFLAGCATPKEHVMPYVNFGYSGEKLFPVSENGAQFTFRAWVSISTSVDRVFTISRDSDFGWVGKLLEIRGHNFSEKDKGKVTYKEINIKPLCGFETFMLKVDSLNLLTLKNQSGFTPAYDTPFSLFVIEIKSNGKNNHFKFNTDYPYKSPVEPEYQKIQELIFKELPFKLYVKR